jgi:hypothetical protein
MFVLYNFFLLATLIIVFTFYTAITVPTNKMSDDLREVVVLFQVLDQGLKLQIILISDVIDNLPGSISCFNSCSQQLL